MPELQPISKNPGSLNHKDWRTLCGLAKKGRIELAQWGEGKKAAPAPSPVILPTSSEEHNQSAPLTEITPTRRLLRWLLRSARLSSNPVTFVARNIVQHWTATLFGLLVTALGTYVSVRYDVSVTNHTSLDPSAPFESRFLVTNDAPFSIYDVTYFCGSAHVRVNGGREITNATEVPIPLGELRPHGSYSIRCQHPRNRAHIDAGAFLEIHVLYRPKYRPWLRKEGGQQFVLKYDADGKTAWLPTGWLTRNRRELEDQHMIP